MGKIRVIVVGAGPAGSFAGYRLAQEGFHVTLLDQAVFPRYKACGGGILAKVSEILPIQREWIEAETASITISHRYKSPIRSSYDRPYTTMVDRERFDQELLKMAKESGVNVFEGVRVIRVLEDVDEIKVYTDTGQIFKADYLFAADGAKSVVAHSLQLSGYRQSLGVALEGDFIVSEEVQKRFTSMMHFNYGNLPSGYSWIFPKKDYLSCGIGTFHPRYRGLKAKLDEYLQKTGIEIKHTLRLKGALIPVGGVNQVFSGKRSFLLGDAAGLVDPITGEGIYYAVKSAELAVTTLCRIASGVSNVKEYDHAILTGIGKELNRARRGARFIFSCSPFIHWIMIEHPELLKVFQQVCCGDAQYSDFFQQFYKKIPDTIFKSAVSLIF